MERNEERIQEFKKLLQEKSDKEITDAEAEDALNNFTGFVDLLWEMSVKDQARKRKLKEFPDGYTIDGEGYSCAVCGNRATWYNKHGNLCSYCQKALDDGTIPDFVPREYESYFRVWEIKSKFKVTHAQMKKYIKEGKLVARIIKTDTDRPHEYIFLRKENLRLIERPSPQWKSYQRKRKKIARDQHRKWKAEFRAEFKDKFKKSTASRRRTKVSGL